MRFGKNHSHKSHINYITTLKGVVGMLRSPESTESVFDIEDGLRNIEGTQTLLEHVNKSTGVAEMIAERYLAPAADIDALDRYPEGSLGKAYARHLLDHGFDPDYFRKIDVVDDIDYVLMRVRQTHDIWHVITGFGTDRVGELGLKAVELAQLRRPMAAVITTGGVLRYLFKDPDNLGLVLWAIAHGYRLGCRAKSLLAQKWEEHWDRPVAQWRAQLNITEALADSPYDVEVDGEALGASEA